MSAIFISHSHQDRESTLEIRTWLESQGYRSIYLDFDPEFGTPAGRSWEEEIYLNLQACRGVIVVCSRNSTASRWVFAEVTQARALGKELFPVKIDECDLHAGLLADRQAVDITQNKEEGLARLGRGLKRAGLDPNDIFDWDRSRPVYPGLLAFQPEDAAVFFGREDEIEAGLAPLRRIRRLGGTAVVMILGNSGSGKSSLARAGLVPRLKKAADQWLVVDPFRPLEDPFLELAVALSRAFAVGPSRQAIHQRLLAGREAIDSTKDDKVPWDDPTSGLAEPNPLVEIANELRVQNDRSEARVLLVVDQFEELLDHPASHPNSAFLHLLRDAAESPHTPVLVLGTMRSDYLGSFQNHPALLEMSYESISLGPMSRGDLALAITKPAQVGGIDLEPGLVETMVADAESKDALPLLAFALRELNERYGADRLLTLHEYEQLLGGLHGAIARAADGVLPSKGLPESEEHALRNAFLAMVSISDDGSFTSRLATWSNLPAEAHPVLERLVNARLLVSGDEDTLGVAHETIFSAWDLLAGWLDESVDALRLRRHIRIAAQQWNDGGRGEDDLWRGVRLDRARLLIADKSVPLDDLDRTFIRASTDAAHLRRKRKLRAAVGAVALVTALLVFGIFQGIRANLESAARQERQAEALLGNGRLLSPRQPELAAIALTESYKRVPDSRTIAAMGDILMGSQRPARYAPEGGSAALAAHPTEGLLAVGTGTGAVELVGLPGLERLGSPFLGLSQSVRRVVFSADGSMVAGVDGGGGVFVWNEESGAAMLREPKAYSEGLRGLAFIPATNELVTAGRKGCIRIWDLSVSSARLEIGTETHDGVIVATETCGDGADPENELNWNELAVHPAETLVVTGSADGLIAWWDTQTGELVRELPDAHQGRIWAAAFTPDGRLLLTAGVDQVIRVWDAASGELMANVHGHTDQIGSIATSQSTNLVATGGFDQIRFWKVNGDGLAPVANPTGNTTAASALAFASDTQILAATNDETVRVFDAVPGGQIGTRVDATGGTVWSMEFAGGGSAIVVVGQGIARVWDPRFSSIQDEWMLDRARWLASSPDGSRVAIGHANMATIIDLATGEQNGVVLHECRSCPVRALAWSPEGRLLASASSNDELIRIYDTQTGEIAAMEAPSRVPLPPSSGRNRPRAEGFRSLTFTGDGLLVSGGNDGAIRTWDPVARTEIAVAQGHQKFVYALAVSPDRSQIASASEDQTVRLWDASELTLIRSFEGHSGAVYAVTFTPDGRYVTSGGDDQIVRVWDPGTGDEAARYLGHNGAVRTIVFAPNGETMLSGGIDGTVRIWDARWETWPDLLCDWMQLPVNESDWAVVMGAENYEPACGSGTP